MRPTDSADATDRAPTFIDASRTTRFSESLRIDDWSVDADLETWHGANARLGDRVHLVFRPTEARYHGEDPKKIAIDVPTIGLEAFIKLIRRLSDAARAAGALPPALVGSDDDGKAA
jgi:hypothetical protein